MAIALKENRPVRGCEAIAERPDGTRIPFIPYPTPLRDAEGRLIGAINMLVDITERKRSEQALRQRERELHEAQRIARMGHWRLDIATAKLEWSAGTHLLMGTSPDDHIPSLKDLISRIHPEDRRPYIHAFIGCLTFRQDQPVGIPRPQQRRPGMGGLDRRPLRDRRDRQGHGLVRDLPGRDRTAPDAGHSFVKRATRRRRPTGPNRPFWPA